MPSAISPFRAFYGLGLFTGLVVATGSSPATLHWPNIQFSSIDTLLYGSSALPLITLNCAARDNTTVGAEWLRIAYHDMSTHDVNDGSGGLDGSIVYELDRPQNIGIGMSNSLTDFNPFASPYVSLSDVIAMGTVLGVASCGGPVIPYRAGRTDATEAGPETVPEPQQDLQTHIASFKRQGFNQTEMIGLVACGHTIGGVRSADFPTIVDESLGVDLAPLDSTVAVFDPAVVTEYLDGTSVNPLVVTPNVTMQSDLRIFSSDNNVTMRSLATEDAFNATCGNLIERMINTVPKEVTFTAPFEPFENKFDKFHFYTNSGSYVMNITFRRLTQNPSRTVTLYWLPRNEPKSYCPLSGCFVNATSTRTAQSSFLAQIKGFPAFSDYVFSVQAPLNASISKFWFVVDENDGSKKTVVDNHGTGYVIEQDTLLYDPKRSHAVQYFNFVVGVKTDSITSKLPIVVGKSWQPTEAPIYIPILGTVDLQLDANHPPADGYTFFSGNFSINVSNVQFETSIHGQSFLVYRNQQDYF